MGKIKIYVADQVDIMSLSLDENDSVDTVKKEIASRKKIPHDFIYLYYNGAPLTSNRTLQDEGVTNRSTITIGVPRSCIIGSTIICFSPGWNFQNMVNVKYTVLFAQLKANKTDRFKDPKKWFFNFYVALQNCGWTLDEVDTTLTSVDVSPDTDETGASIAGATLKPRLHGEYEKRFLDDTLKALQSDSNVSLYEVFENDALLDVGEASFQVIVGGLDFKHLDIAFIQCKTNDDKDIDDVLYQIISSDSSECKTATNVMYFDERKFNYMKDSVYQEIDVHLAKVNYLTTVKGLPFQD